MSAAYGVVLEDPELLESLRRIFEHETKLRRKYPDKPSWWEWEIGDVGVPPWHVVKLVRLGIVERTYASSNHKYYRLVDYDSVAELLARASSGQGKGRPRGGVSNLAPPKEEKIPEDLFDIIIGYDDLKWLFKKSLTAERYHILLVGPPATAKTLFLLELARVPGSVFIDVPHATKVGIREVILGYRPRYLLLDEIDKASSEDFWHGLANIMETGRISYAKHGEYVDIQVNVNIYATANWAKALPDHILSRFDKYELEPYDDETLHKIIVNLLVKQYRKPRRIAEGIADFIVYELGSRDVRDAIKAAKIVDTEEDMEMYRRTKMRYARRRKR